MSHRAKTEKRAIGDAGERRVAWYLRFRGYRILERNWRSGHKEVDIIAAKRGVIAFVEVKTRLSASAGLPQMAVTRDKMANITAAARAYSMLHDTRGRLIRFDMAEVTDKGINYIKSAFHG